MNCYFTSESGKMKKQLYIHVGFPKTGTTSLQSFLGKNQVELRDKFGLDYLYYAKPRSTHYSAFAYCYNSMFTGNLTQIDPETTILDIVPCPEIVGELFSKLRASPYNRILISSESFIYLKDLSFYKEEIFRDFEVKIIVYVRSAIEYLCSLWSYRYNLLEDSALRYPDLETFVTDNNEYKEQLNNIFELGVLFGNDNVLVRTFEKERFKEVSLIEDFLEILGISDTSGFSNPVHENSNISTRKVNDVIKSLSLVYEDIQQKYSDEDFEELLAKLEGGDSRRAIETLDDSLIKEVCDSYADIEKRIAREFCKREQLFIRPYPSCFGSERPAYMPLTAKDNLTILMWAVSVAVKKITFKDRIFWSLLDGFYVSKLRKLIINLLPSKKLRHQLRDKFR